MNITKNSLSQRQCKSKNKGVIEETITKICQHTHSTQVRLTVHKNIPKNMAGVTNKE